MPKADICFLNLFLTNTVEIGISFYCTGLKKQQKVEQIHNLVSYEEKKRKKALNNLSCLGLLFVYDFLQLHFCHYFKSLIL